MSTDPAPALLKAQLAHTWPIFFARHGNFTSIQLQAIPPILEGQNTLVMAATATGKTEAAIAPLLERYLSNPSTPSLSDARASLAQREPEPRILYISPTRALVRDLFERLRLPLESLGLSLAMKSGDSGPLPRLPRVLITTPESTDSLLTRTARSFARLQAVVIDEIHLLDDGPRGDHVRCLINRIETIRSYHHEVELGIEPTPLQRVALSATVTNPTDVASRYLATDKQGAVLVEVAGRRELDAQIMPAPELEDVSQALLWRSWGNPPVRKSLVFCNTRREVEQTAAYLRGNLGYEASIFVHYSNLDPAMRRRVEQDFALAATAICVSTSTLELGIDIGDIDDVVLVGPPPSLATFLQRIGRGNRRSNVCRVLCLARDRFEELQFRALIELAERSTPSSPDDDRSITCIGKRSTESTVSSPGAFFRPSVLIQQVFSLLKQSPTGGVRMADLRRIAPVDWEERVLRSIGTGVVHAILDNLVTLGYLRRGRPGDWRPGAELDLLLEAHEIYSNIGSDPLSVLVVDAYSGRTLARMERSQVRRPHLQLDGKMWSVVWRDGYRVGVQVGGQGVPDESFSQVVAPLSVSLEMGQAVAAHLGVASSTLPVIQDLHGTWVCHFWGDLYGRWLVAMLQGNGAHPAAQVEVVNEYVLYVHGRLRQLPPWDEAAALHHLRVLAPTAIPFLELGRFHALLPPTLAWQTVVTACDPARFEILYRQAHLASPTDELEQQLRPLL